MTKKYILGAINIAITISLVILLSIGLILIKLLNKPKTIVIIITLILLITLIICSYFSKNHQKYNAGVFIALLLNIILAFEVNNMNSSYSYISNIINKKYDYITYNIYVKKANTTYSNINKLNNKKIGLLKTNQENIEKMINKEVKVEYIEYNNIEELSSGIENGEIQAFIIDSKETENLKKEDISNKNKEVSYDNHNLWLIDDRLSFSQFISSDKSISAIKNNYDFIIIDRHLELPSCQGLDVRILAVLERQHSHIHLL